MNKTIHIAEVIADGGRDGRVETPSGSFAVKLSTDESADAVTPEHLFAGAYGACFLGALKAAAEKSHFALTGGVVTCQAYLEEDDDGGYNLKVKLRATLPNTTESQTRKLLQMAHQTCPYSKATRNNIPVALETD